MALITISGAQGQGKTTILTSLAELGYNVVSHKTSRSILDEWGYTLAEVNEDLELKKKFQDEIIERHYQTNLEAASSPDLYFSERSFADVFSYTILTLGPFNEYSSWLDDYYRKCKEYQKIYDAVLLIGGRDDSVENDGVRSVNAGFRTVFNLILDHYTDDFTDRDRIWRVYSPDHTERMKQILDAVNSRE